MKIEVVLKSFEYKLIENALASFPFRVQSYTVFPSTRQLFTVLRSPHIDKKSREQFEIRRYKATASIEPKTLEECSHVLDVLHHIQCIGVQIQIRVHSNTFLRKEGLEPTRT